MILEKELIKDYLVGTDCEVFLRDKNTGKIITSEGIIKGTKKEPFKFDSENEHYATSLDCVLSEFTTEPCKTSGQFYLAIEKALRYINEMIPENLETVAIPAARLDEDQLQSSIANEFGCESSLNCWTLDSVRPQPTGDTLRSAGLHLHCSYENATTEISLNLARAMDVFLGIPSVLLEPENERKTVGYGCAGNIRMQNHGVEYRTLSSHFASSQELIEWSFKQTEAAIKFINEGRIDEIINDGEEIQSIINTTDKVLAQQWVDRFNIQMPK